MVFQSVYTGEQIERAVGAAQNIASFSATFLSSDWVGEEAPFIQTISIEGMSGADRPVIDIVQSEDMEVAQAELEAWAMISKIETGEGSITATCYSDKPEVDLNLILLRVV